MLAPCCPQSLDSSLCHANMTEIFQAGGRVCWRPAARKALILRLARQHEASFLGRWADILAPCCQQRLDSSSSHANMTEIFQAGGRVCWRPAACKASIHYRTTPTMREVTPHEAVLVSPYVFQSRGEWLYPGDGTASADRRITSPLESFLAYLSYSNETCSWHKKSWSP